MIKMSFLPRKYLFILKTGENCLFLDEKVHFPDYSKCIFLDEKVHFLTIQTALFWMKIPFRTRKVLFCLKNRGKKGLFPVTRPTLENGPVMSTTDHIESIQSLKVPEIMLYGGLTVAYTLIGDAF